MLKTKVVALVLVVTLLAFSVTTLGGIGASYDGRFSYLLLEYQGFFLDYNQGVARSDVNLYNVGISPSYDLGSDIVRPYFATYVELAQYGDMYLRHGDLLESTVIGGGIDIDLGPLNAGAGIGTDLQGFSPYNIDDTTLRPRAYLNVDFISLYYTLIESTNET